jgi:starvation-inducible DNA-binding protein
MDDTMDELIKATKIAFATEFSFYLKAHYFHWNVEGPDFKEYHDLFGVIYEEVYGSIDDFAENIRKLGS